ncbi:2-dehydro-3-deoxyphosphogluconate aldolase/(4S)-4-hydroxy-2-oxoglutarate aldolase [Sinobaca qinghaiensis]|uniref:2-dehydro-3-deoxyphosphogluconate aldolase/(4S)-4-hydroxy-2-oxoglutarate aldolase n=1 Tax=Sinobaca qinghaiensis TaxID=342944 RepID=A0A419V858_9BACL|nr:bifunctional 4-hydroxy-2-oxoglutarate aldolase/2-dehydro-3-deoxy-phosphogluconate aldolase [Sinobaca qinghaiensis]RKD76109.1 2-dehydro-3-deoxyphosphogluconate aldolase/(4S)-4-hydroxy-2-oxoglutarate aldolase [Sinobaca qinghaiensis]
MKNQVLETLKEKKLAAIIRTDSSKDLDKTIESLYRGGIHFIEVTLNTPQALNVIEENAGLYDDLYLGAGTVLDKESAAAAIRAGASFLLTPTLDEEVIRTGSQYGVPVIPGVMTPTEILAAYRAGAEVVKIFPAHTLGSSYLKDVKGPLPFVEAMAVGGISKENVPEYLQKGWHSAGIGSSLVNPEWIKNQEFERIEKQAAAFADIVRSAERK